jgi:hypothetical protein
VTSEAAQDQGWGKSEPREESEAARLSRHKPRWCSLCESFCSHFADACDKSEVEPVEADPSFVASQLLEARKALRKTR